MTQAELFRFVIETLERTGITYMVVGSFASGAYGEPRLTHDIDIVIDPTPDQLAQLCTAFSSDEFYVSPEAARAALAHRSQFNVIHPDSGNKIDFVLLKGDAYSHEQIGRRQRLKLLPDTEGFAARPEDVILGKLVFYQEGGSEKHLRDIAGMLKVSREQIDLAYLRKWVTILDLTDAWRVLEERIAGAARDRPT